MHLERTSKGEAVFEEETLRLFPDVDLRSSDGGQIRLNRAMLAAVSPVLREALADWEADVIWTEMAWLRLQTSFHPPNKF